MLESKSYAFLDQTLDIHADIEAGIEGHAEITIPIISADNPLLSTKFFDLKCGMYLFVEVEGSVMFNPQLSFRYSKDEGLKSDADVPSISVSGKIRAGIGVELGAQIGKYFDIGIDARVGISVEGEDAEFHDSCWLCLKGDVMIEATIAIKFDLNLFFHKKRQ